MNIRSTIPEKVREKIGNTLLLFGIVFMISIVFFLIQGEIKIGTGSGIPIYETVRFSEFPAKFTMIVSVTSIITLSLFAGRWYILKKD